MYEYIYIYIYKRHAEFHLRLNKIIGIYDRNKLGTSGGRKTLGMHTKWSLHPILHEAFFMLKPDV